MAQKVNIELWVKSNATKAVGTVKGAFGSLRQSAANATGKVLELGTQLQSVQNAGAQCAGVVAEAFDALATGGPIGMATAALVLMVTKFFEAKQQAEQLDQQLAEHFASGMEKLRAIAKTVRMDRLTQDMDDAIAKSEALTDEIKKINTSWNLEKNKRDAKASAANAKAMAGVESQRLSQRAKFGTDWEREQVDLSAEVKKQRLIMEEQNRIAEEAVKLAEHDLAMKKKESAMMDQKNEILEREIERLEEEYRSVHSVEEKKQVQAMIDKLDNQIVKNKERQIELDNGAREAEVKLQRATDKLSITRANGANRVYAAQQNLSNAYDKHAEEEKKAAAKMEKDAKDDKVREIRADLLKAKSAYEQALTNIGKSPAAKGDNAGDFVKDFRNKLAQDRQNKADRDKAQRRKAQLEAKEERMRKGKGKLGGKMSKKDAEELDALRHFFGEDEESKKKMKIAEESKKHLENIEKQLADALKVG